MAPTLYYLPASPPVRTVLITAKAIDLDLNLVETNLLAAAHLQEDYIKLNPQHTIPTLVDDDGFAVWDSHAIIAYLVSKYGKNDALYPKDFQKRAVIDQRLHFDTGIAFPRLRAITYPLIFCGKPTIDEEDKTRAVEVYEFLERFLADNEWIAGNSVSIADYSLIATITSLTKLVPLDKEKFVKVAQWIGRCENLPEYEANREGLQQLEVLIKNKFIENQK